VQRFSTAKVNDSDRDSYSCDPIIGFKDTHHLEDASITQFSGGGADLFGFGLLDI
jgi:hypothetical protein